MWKKWIPDPDKNSETPRKGKVVEQSFIYYIGESEGQGGWKVEGVVVMKDEELNLEEIEVFHTPGGSWEVTRG